MDQSENNTILLTGVNGFLGNYLTPVLLQHGYVVFGIGKGICRLNISEKNFHYYSLDICNTEQLNTVFPIIKPSIIIHAAANSKPDDCELNKDAAFATNVKATDSLLQLASVTQSKFIYISTDFVFDGKKGLYNEMDECIPINYYGQTKLLSENLVSQYSYEYAIIRTVLVYGKPLAGRSNILSTIHDKLKNKKSIQLVNDQFRTPTYIKDLVWGILQVVQYNKNGIWHLSGDEPLMSPYEMGTKLAQICQLDTSLIIPVNHSTFKEVALRPETTGLNILKAKTELGFHPTPFENAIHEIFLS